MRVFEVTLSEDRLRAFVVLRPSWWEKVWGTKSLIVELIRDPATPVDGYTWRSAVTNRILIQMPYGVMIRDALEARPVGAAPEVPVARWVQKEDK